MRLLGTAADQDVALRLGRTVASVQKKRYEVHINGCNPAHRFWTDQEIKLLGIMTWRHCPNGILLAL